jgi:hypothetical protein
MVSFDACSLELSIIWLPSAIAMSLKALVENEEQMIIECLFTSH